MEKTQLFNTAEELLSDIESKHKNFYNHYDSMKSMLSQLMTEINSQEQEISSLKKDLEQKEELVSSLGLPEPPPMNASQLFEDEEGFTFIPKKRK